MVDYFINQNTHLNYYKYDYLKWDEKSYQGTGKIDGQFKGKVALTNELLILLSQILEWLEI